MNRQDIEAVVSDTVRRIRESGLGRSPGFGWRVTLVQEDGSVAIYPISYFEGTRIVFPLPNGRLSSVCRIGVSFFLWHPDQYYKGEKMNVDLSVRLATEAKPGA